MGEFSFDAPTAITGRVLFTNTMKDLFLLLDTIHLSFNNPDYQPHDGITYCNKYVNDVCAAMGFIELNGKTANEIIDTLITHPKWTEVQLEDSQALANQGTLIVAGTKGDRHGHVVIICPGKVKISGRWGYVPGCASFGIDNTIGKGINWSFREKPKFWAWKNTL